MAERVPIPHVDPDSFSLPPPSSCFCGAEPAVTFRGWPLCHSCAPRVRLAWCRDQRGGVERVAIPKGKR